MMTNEYLRMESACRRLVHRYCMLADAGRSEEAAALYEPDGVLEIGGQRFAGRHAIADRLAGAPPDQVSRHVCANMLVDAISDNEARGFAYVLLFRGGPNPIHVDPTLPLLVGEYEDVFAAADGRNWMFRSRRLTTVFRKRG